MDFKTQLNGFLQGAQKVIDDYYVAQGYAPVQGKKLEIQEGKRYLRIVARDMWNGEVRAESGSAWAFIDSTNGDILKPASWKAPAKVARGNINEDDFGVKNVTAYGPRYLR